MGKKGGAGFDPPTPPQQLANFNQLPYNDLLEESVSVFYLNVVFQCAHAEEARHRVRGRILLEGRIFTLSKFDKFYMVSTLLDTKNAIALFVSPPEFCIFGHFSLWRYKTRFCN